MLFRSWLPTRPITFVILSSTVVPWVGVVSHEHVVFYFFLVVVIPLILVFLNLLVQTLNLGEIGLPGSFPFGLQMCKLCVLRVFRLLNCSSDRVVDFSQSPICLVRVASCLQFKLSLEFSDPVM